MVVLSADAISSGDDEDDSERSEDVGADAADQMSEYGGRFTAPPMAQRRHTEAPELQSHTASPVEQSCGSAVCGWGGPVLAGSSETSYCAVSALSKL